jgi:hypothetical protein
VFVYGINVTEFCRTNLTTSIPINANNCFFFYFLFLSFTENVRQKEIADKELVLSLLDDLSGETPTTPLRLANIIFVSRDRYFSRYLADWRRLNCNIGVVLKPTGKSHSNMLANGDIIWEFSHFIDGLRLVYKKVKNDFKLHLKVKNFKFLHCYKFSKFEK